MKRHPFLLWVVPGVLIFFLFAADLSAFFFNSGRATLGFTGDIMMHINVKRCASVMNRKDAAGSSVNNGGFNYLYEEIKPLFDSMDFVSGNMEFPVSPPFKQRGIVFNAPRDAIRGVQYAGFDLVSIANNHILDQYVKGARDTMGYLEKFNFPYVGAGRDVSSAHKGKITRVNGIKVGMLAYAGLVNYPERNTGRGFHLNWIYDTDQVIKDIKRMKKECDYLVLQVHTGVEYVLEPRESDRKLFQQLCDEGVDLIIGHHPHMLQNMEGYTTRDGRETTIFYSLGNFISDQKRYVPVRNTGKQLCIRDSVVVQVELRETFGSISDSFTVIPIHTVHEYRTRGGVRYKDIQTVVISTRLDELTSARSRYSRGSVQYKKLSSEIDYLKARREAVKLTLFRLGKPSNVDLDE